MGGPRRRCLSVDTPDESVTLGFGAPSPPRDTFGPLRRPGEVNMNDRATSSISAPIRPFPVVTAIFLAVVILGCSVYANLSFTVTDKVNYKYFPPFEPHNN